MPATTAGNLVDLAANLLSKNAIKKAMKDAAKQLQLKEKKAKAEAKLKKQKETAEAKKAQLFKMIERQ